MSDPRKIVQSVLAIIVGACAAIAVGFYLWKESQNGAWGAELMLVIGPVAIGGLLLAWQYRSDLKKDLCLAVTLPITACVLCCVASLPQVFGLYEFGFGSPRKFATSVGGILLLQTCFWPFARAYFRCLYQALESIDHFFKGDERA